MWVGGKRRDKIGLWTVRPKRVRLYRVFFFRSSRSLCGGGCVCRRRVLIMGDEKGYLDTS